MEPYDSIFEGGDLRSIGKSEEIFPQIKTQKDFEALFSCLYHSDRRVVMRAADAIEKVSRKRADLLAPHAKKLLELCAKAHNKELQWHLALLIARMNGDEKQMEEAIEWLKKWALDPSSSAIVKVNSLQGLFDLAQLFPVFAESFQFVATKLEKERIPSVQARLRKGSSSVEFRLTYFQSDSY